MNELKLWNTNPDATPPPLDDSKQPSDAVNTPTPEPAQLSDDERSELTTLRKEKAIQAVGITESKDIEHMMSRLNGIDDPDEVNAVIDDVLRQMRMGKYREYADPVSKGNGVANPPKQVDQTEVGASMARRILEKRRYK